MIYHVYLTICQMGIVARTTSVVASGLSYKMALVWLTSTFGRCDLAMPRA